MITQKGRERVCEAKLQNLNEVSEWVEQYRVFWTSKLNALDKFLLNKPAAIKRKKKQKK
jgi:hypothetical protein